MTDKPFDPNRELLRLIAEAMAKETDRQMLEGTTRADDIKAEWVAEDEPIQNVLRSTPKVEGKYFGQPMRLCDCPTCTAAVEEERRMWAGVGIDVFGEVE